MYPKDVETIFKNVPVGTPVYIVNQPFKVGVAFGKIYLEAHPHLEEDSETSEAQYADLVAVILAKLKDLDADLSWADIKKVLEDRSGIPVPVGNVKLDPVEVIAEARLARVVEGE